MASLDILTAALVAAGSVGALNALGAAIYSAVKARAKKLKSSRTIRVQVDGSNYEIDVSGGHVEPEDLQQLVSRIEAEGAREPVVADDETKAPDAPA